MSIVDKQEVASLDAPYRRVVRLEKVWFESGMEMFRVVIREGHRITQIDLDAATAGQWAKIMGDWAACQPGEDEAAPE